jgi:hypothetical protein
MNPHLLTTLIMVAILFVVYLCILYPWLLPTLVGIAAFAWIYGLIYICVKGG